MQVRCPVLLYHLRYSWQILQHLHFSPWSLFPVHRFSAFRPLLSGHLPFSWKPSDQVLPVPVLPCHPSACLQASGLKYPVPSVFRELLHWHHPRLVYFPDWKWSVPAWHLPLPVLSFSLLISYYICSHCFRIRRNRSAPEYSQHQPADHWPFSVLLPAVLLKMLWLLP